MSRPFLDQIADTLTQMAADGLYKGERQITSAPSGTASVQGRDVINLCANNYLGLADHPVLIQAAKDALDTHGVGLASMRVICGTQDLHRGLEARLAQDMAARLFDEGVYVAGFFFPVVPRGQARIRTQMNAALTRDALDRARAAFGKVGRALGVVP